MNNAYHLLVNEIFGAGSAKPPTSLPANEVTGALQNETSYQEFTARFGERLRRLAQAYTPSSPNRQKLLTKVNDVSATRWQGPYAELCAYDFYNQRDAWPFRGLTLDVDLPNGSTYGAALGSTGPANLDGLFDRYDVYTDVKVLKDNVTEILNSVITQAVKQTGQTPRHYGWNWPHDKSVDTLNPHRSNLVNELAAALIKKPKAIPSAVVENLVFRFDWTEGSLATEHSYNAYKHARSSHTLVFGYANKFIQSKPFLLTLVSFPWFNGVVTSFGGANKAFYRAFARRVFMQYRLSQQPFSTVQSKFNGPDTIHEVLRRISGIVFIEDLSLLGKAPESRQARSYCFLNPHAANPVPEIFRDYLRALDGLYFNDFKGDTY